MAKALSGDLDGPIEILTRAILVNDKDADAKALLGMAYSQKGLHAQAKRALQTAVEMTPGSADFRCNYGVVLEHAGELPAAAVTYQQALQINPHHELSRQRLQVIGPAAPLPHAAALSHPPFQQHPQATQTTQMPVFGTPLTGAASPWQPASAPPTLPPATAATPTQANKPGQVTCARCGQETRQGLSCEWCNAALRPPTPAPQQSAGPTPAPVSTMAYEPAVAMAALDAHKHRSRGAMTDGLANYWVIRGVIGAVSLAASLGFAVFRHSMRSAARERGTSTISLNINGQASQLKGALATLDTSLGNTLVISAGNDADTALFLDLPTHATSRPQLAGQSLTKTIALDQVSELDDVPDILSMGRQFYVAEKVTANVSTASDKQITVTLDASFREVDQTTGQFKTSIPVSGTVTLKVSKE